MNDSSVQRNSRAWQSELALDAIIGEILDCAELEPGALDRILRRHPKDGRGFYSKREILRAFRERQGQDGDSAAFAERLRTCPTRSISGITPVTVLTKPFPCPGRCVFCPSDARMPKSYVASEPGCQRAAANGFDPYRQTWSRLAAYHAMGHPTAKIELIVLGGTWSFYPEAYQVWFVARCFEALCDFAPGRDPGADPRGEMGQDEPGFAELRAAPGQYNRVVGDHLRRQQGGELLAEFERADWDRLEAAQERNERAASRCVGLALETRPDHVTEAEVERLRRLGATKIQVGVQSLSDRILAANQRGHDVAATRAAIGRLRSAGFKIHAHWMPNLLGATPESDRTDFARLFDDPAIRPDELKIYPTSLLETAELVIHHRAGRWQPYAQDELVELLADCMAQVPPWCRVTRVIRDIPSPEILVGNKQTNLREVVEARCAERGLPLRDIRSREIRGRPVHPMELSPSEHDYESANGRELFLEETTRSGHVAAFLRLALPERPAALSELAGSALIRELHVYGTAAALGEREPGRAQHAGLGRRLLERAVARAAAAGFSRLAVISAVGTRAYYRRHGFRDGALYQHRALS